MKFGSEQILDDLVEEALASGLPARAENPDWVAIKVISMISSLNDLSSPQLNAIKFCKSEILGEVEGTIPTDKNSILNELWDEIESANGRCEALSRLLVSVVQREKQEDDDFYEYLIQEAYMGGVPIELIRLNLIE